MTPESTLIERRPRTARPPTEGILAELLAGVLGIDRVPVDGHFFEELGADSLLMARFCARVRKRGDLGSIAIQDTYRHPTIRRLAAALADGAPHAIKPPHPAPVAAPEPATTLEYVTCGVLQLLSFLGYSYLVVVGGGWAYGWIAAAPAGAALYLRLVLCGGAAFVIVCATPILAKWLLIGRWKPGRIRLWSLGYVRFWFVKTLIRANPCALLFVGSPLYVLYLRALGAKIGARAAIFSRRIPVCTDLLTIGADTVIRRESFFQGYRVQASRIEIGTVTIGRDAVVGERTALDIDTAMGDGAQLGHSSSLHSGQRIPSGERWHGSPARRTDVDYLRIAPMPVRTLRRVWFSVGTLLLVLFVYLPFAQSIPFLLAPLSPVLARILEPGPDVHLLREFLLGALNISLFLTFGGALIGLPVVLVVTRVLNLFLEPDRVYPLYGFHDRAQRAIMRLSNIKFFIRLFGDSSYIVHFLGWLGYRLKPLEQTGSNFGTGVAHSNPHLCSVGTGTMVADGLTFMNDEVSSTSFSVSRVSVGPRNFVGNDVAYPPGGRTGDNCLLATKVMVPLDGPIRRNTGLLGSPSFEISRTVERDTRFADLRTGDGFSRRLAAKNRHNLRTMGLFLLVRWLGLFIFTLIDLGAFALYGAAGHLLTAALLAAGLLVMPLYYALVERCLTGFRSFEPLYCSIYDPRFWKHERLWKVPALDYLHSFDGTAYKVLIWRLMGVRVGRRVIDDGIHIPERTLVTIGDHCALNLGSTIQCHSQEDGIFKTDRTAIGEGCTLGIGSLVHYGVTMGDGATLAIDSFLMKGEEVPAHAQWGGNPAREL